MNTKITEWQFKMVGDNIHLIGYVPSCMDGIVTTPIVVVNNNEVVTFDDTHYTLVGNSSSNADAAYIFRHVLDAWGISNDIVRDLTLSDVISVLSKDY